MDPTIILKAGVAVVTAIIIDIIVVYIMGIKPSARTRNIAIVIMTVALFAGFSLF